MKLLLDTHALLWWLAGDDRLGARTREQIAEPANEVLVSIVSLWEIVVKARVGKLQADCGDVFRAVERDGFVLLAVMLPHLLTLAGLATYHRDLFDHLLIAQAITEGARLRIGGPECGALSGADHSLFRSEGINDHAAFLM